MNLSKVECTASYKSSALKNLIDHFRSWLISKQEVPFLYKRWMHLYEHIGHAVWIR